MSERTLAELIPELGMEREAFFRVAVPLAAELSTFHDGGVVHGSLRPEKITMTDDGVTILEAELSNASMITLNYTLQFLPIADRDRMIASIHAALVDNGLLVLSEKVVDPDPAMETLLVELHHEHKRRNDYSALEISRKRTALENVLIPETVTAHRERLLRAGFRSAAVWLRFFNFVSIIAIR